MVKMIVYFPHAPHAMSDAQPTSHTTRPDIVFIGPYGSGKTSQAMIIARRDGHVFFSAGRALGEYVSVDTPERRALKATMEKGDLVPVHITVDFLEELIHENPGSRFVIDGMPRSAEQAELFDAMMRKRGRRFVVVLLHLSDEESLRRQVERRTCPVCHRVYTLPQTTCAVDGATLVLRPDNDPAVARRRIEVYHHETNPLIEHYRPMGLVEIDGAQGIEEVARDIERALA